MAILPASGSNETVGIEIVSVADNAGIEKSEAGLAALDAESQKLSSSTSKLASSQTSLSSSMSKASGDIEKVGKSMSTYITLPAIAVGAASSEMAYKFSNAMELLHTSAGISQDALKGLSDQVLAMAGQVGQAPEALAQGLYHIASAGNGIWNTAQMMDILKVAAEGANLGMANLDDTTYSLTSAMASGVKGVKDASEMMAVLTATVGAGDMKMNDLNGALSTGILSTAATFGVSIQSIGAALATLTDNGEHADEAATRLRMTMSLMTSPSSQAAKQLAALGLTAEDASVATANMNEVFAKTGLTTTKLADDLRQPNGIGVAINDLKDHLEAAGLSASETDAILSKAFGGGRTDAALLTLIQNSGRIDDKFKAINDSAGQFQNKLNDLNNTDNQKLRDAWASIQADLIELGSKVLPIAADLLQRLTGMVNGLMDAYKRLSPSQKEFAKEIGMIAVSAGPVLVMIGTLGKSLAGIIKLFEGAGAATLGWVGVALAAVAALVILYQKSQTFRDIIASLINIMRPFVQIMIEVVKAGFEQMMKAIDPLIVRVQNLWQHSEIFRNTIKALAIALGVTVVAPILLLMSTLAALGLVVEAIITGIANFINWVFSMGRAVKSTINDIVHGDFGTLKSQVLGALGDTGKWLYDAGSKIIHGLINGVNSAIGDLGKAIGNAANAAGNAVGGALHSLHLPGFATGTNYARGGWSWVGENGPELVNLPSGSQVRTATQSRAPSPAGGSTTVTIGTVVLQNQSAAKEFFRQLNQDTMNLGKGLTAIQGMY